MRTAIEAGCTVEGRNADARRNTVPHAACHAHLFLLSNPWSRSNNEVGSLQPVAEAAAAARQRGVLVHCDAAQVGSGLRGELLRHRAGRAAGFGMLCDARIGANNEGSGCSARAAACPPATLLHQHALPAAPPCGSRLARLQWT